MKTAQRENGLVLQVSRAVSLSDMFYEILQENNPFARQKTSSTAQQLDGYLSEVPTPRSNNPLKLWRTNQGRFPEPGTDGTEVHAQAQTARDCLVLHLMSSMRRGTDFHVRKQRSYFS